MTLKTFGILVAVMVALLLAYGAWRLTRLWEYQTLGPYAVRRNTLTGRVEIDPSAGRTGTYAASFENDHYADAVPVEDLRRIRIVDPAWTPDGILAARALVAPGRPIKGRFALQILIRDTKRMKRLRDRSLRITVDWPAGAPTPFVIDTGLTPPDASNNEQAILAPQPTFFGGATAPGSVNP